jgi:predicted transposase/invertase (TIGR01784 family)
LQTDSLFFHIFKTSPSILFELLGQSASLAENYSFDSVEIKQVGFRIDGVLLPKPDAIDQTVIFLEVQFQKDPTFYHRLIAEIHLFLKLNPSTFDWKAVVIFPRRSIEPTDFRLFRNLIHSDQVHRIYLEDLKAPSDGATGLDLMRLVVAKKKDAVSQAKDLLSRTRQRAVTEPQLNVIMGLVETVIIYKFPKLGREEIAKMLGLSELKDTKVYQEGRTEGKLEGEQSVILRQLARRIGNVTPDQQDQIRALSIYQLEALAEALLGFSQPDELTNWLQISQG